ncbi:type II toxin-antitoxin system VapC family toxin [Mycobacterium sp. CVI_P3]|uniref:Ribonuclease VapC n=1 Tax=Mycobacterium pinniadriaticum TaxID=2994102 RepID=A0ABT3S6H7_9MYCO|nr:type II toxin-antitoxin system VapC family toxin [Mycobacterium pinniadriaticum]MCX2929029.1 type II toxin-antitoxin system VapC family toxin [Mycobacterium pinniadriaticum]MCX2935104.1 type II toxin-antitoxin system VapC family toxin [Mycobacterium pinniadriaticum]
MIFVDTNVFMYAVGREHPLRRPARDFFEHSVERHRRLVTSVEVLQELLHAYIPADRIDTLDAALTLARSLTEIWSIEESDVAHARALCDRYRALGARDFLHLACCQRRGVTEIKTFDRALASAFG